MPGKRLADKPWGVLLPVLPLLLGCSLAGAAGGTDFATQTALAQSIILYSTMAAGRFPSPTNTPPGVQPNPPTVTATPLPSGTQTPTEPLTPVSTAAFAHTATPPAAGGLSRFIIDAQTRDYAPQQKVESGSDVHLVNRYERPYTAETMEYLSDVDLTRVEMSITPPWVCITFHIGGPRPEGVGRTMYGIEFDTNRDGRGEYLIWAVSPPDGNWTTAGVEVRRDSNADVGGPNPQWANAPWLGGDGYDKVLFSSGSGSDADLAWTRQIDGGRKIQLAFKYIAIGNAEFFLWNGVADFGLRRPEWFDYNDHFTQSEAGSPLPIQAQLYPLHALWGIDNTCRDAYGYEPDGAELGLCM